MAETLTEALRELATQRLALANEQELVKECEAWLAETPQGKKLTEYKESAAKARARCDAADARVRELALASYAATGSKQPAKGVTIRVGKRLVYDRIKASEWARANAPALFALDIKAWEKAAPTLPDAPIEVVEEPSVAIASDLAGI